MAIDVVSQHGPNAQGVRSRPDRSVSLPVPDARGVAAEMMGGVGNLALKRLQKQHDDLISRYERLAPDSPNAPYNQERDELLQAIDEIEEQIRKMDPPPPPPPVEVLDLDDPAARKAALAKWGAPHLGAVPDLPPGTSAMSGVEGVPGGFDFDSFDADLAKAIEGTLESAAPVTAEQSEPWDLVGESAIAIRDAVGSYVANVAGFNWEDMETVEEMADVISHDLLGETDDVDRQDLMNDRVWSEIFEAAEQAGFDYSLGEFFVDPRLEPYHEAWDREDREERAAQWEDPRPHSDDEFSHESRAVGPLSGLPGFQSPSVSPGSPAFQGMPAPKGPQGFQPAAVLPQPGGYQGAPPSVQSMLTAMSGEPSRIGRAHPERPPAPYEPVPEISEEQKKINKEAIEQIRKDHNLYEGMDPELLRNILLAAGIGAGAAAFGGGGMLGGVGIGAFR